MYLYIVTFKAVNNQARVRNAGIQRDEPYYDEAGYQIDANNIRVVARNFGDASSWADANGEGRELMTIRQVHPVAIAAPVHANPVPIEIIEGA